MCNTFFLFFFYALVYTYIGIYYIAKGYRNCPCIGIISVKNDKLHYIVHYTTVVYWHSRKLPYMSVIGISDENSIIPQYRNQFSLLCLLAAIATLENCPQLLSNFFWVFIRENFYPCDTWKNYKCGYIHTYFLDFSKKY